MFTKKRIKILYFAIAATLITSTAFSQNSNTIDGKTSASKRYEVKGGEAYENNATIRWSSRYSNGTLNFNWGKKSNSLDNSINMYPYKKNSTAEIKLTNLTAGTTYYYSIDGTYKGKTYNNLITGSFTTTYALSTYSSFTVNETKNQNISLMNNKLYTNLLFIPNDEIIIYNSVGVVVKKVTVSSLRNTINMSFLSTGYYIFKLLRNNKIVYNSKGTIL